MSSGPSSESSTSSPKQFKRSEEAGDAEGPEEVRNPSPSAGSSPNGGGRSPSFSGQSQESVMEEYKTLMESFLEMHQRLTERTERAKASLTKEKEKNDKFFYIITSSFRLKMEEVSDLLLLYDTKVVRRISILS